MSLEDHGVTTTDDGEETALLAGNRGARSRWGNRGGTGFFGVLAGVVIIGGIVSAIVFTRKGSDNSSETTVEFQNSSPFTLKLTDQSGDGANSTYSPELNSHAKEAVKLASPSSWADLEYDVYHNETYVGHLGVRVLPGSITVSNENNVFVITGPQQDVTTKKMFTTKGDVRPGLNQAGFEFGSNSNQINPPTHTDVNTANANLFSSLRMPFKLEYASTDGMTIDPNFAYVQKYLAQVEYALKHNNQVIVEPHNYMLFNGRPITAEQCQHLIGGAFVSLFKDLYNKYPGKLMVEAMNEPTDAVTSQDLVDCYTPLVQEARQNGFNGTIGIEGNTWATPSVFTNPDGTPTEQFNALLPLLTEDKNGEMELGVHCYFDGAGGGGPGTGECVDANSALEINRIPQLTALAKQHGIKIRITETGVINTPNCLNVLKALMAHIYANPDVYAGYNAWVQTPVSNPAWSPLLVADLENDPRAQIMKDHINSGTGHSIFGNAQARSVSELTSSSSNFSSTALIGAAVIPGVLLLMLVYFMYKKFYAVTEIEKTDVEKGQGSVLKK